MSRLRPKVVLWWGIGLIVASLILNYALFGLISATSGSGANSLDQAMLSAIMQVLDAVNRIAPMLGAAFVGASIVMFSITKNDATEPVVAEHDTTA